MEKLEIGEYIKIGGWGYQIIGLAKLTKGDWKCDQYLLKRKDNFEAWLGVENDNGNIKYVWYLDFKVETLNPKRPLKSLQIKDRSTLIEGKFDSVELYGELRKEVENYKDCTFCEYTSLSNTNFRVLAKFWGQKAEVLTGMVQNIIEKIDILEYNLDREMEYKRHNIKIKDFKRFIIGCLLFIIIVPFGMELYSYYLPSINTVKEMLLSDRDYKYLESYGDYTIFTTNSSPQSVKSRISYALPSYKLKTEHQKIRDGYPEIITCSEEVDIYSKDGQTFVKVTMLPFR